MKYRYDIDRPDDSFIEKLFSVGLPLRGTYFDPVSPIMIIGMALSAVAAVASGVSSFVQGNAQASMARQQADYARAMAARNQAIAEQSAQAAEAKGQYEAGLQQERAKSLMGKQIALTGGSGVDLSGSLLEPIGQSWSEGQRDAKTTLFNAAYDAWKYRTAGGTSLLEGDAQASRYDEQAAFESSKGTTSLAFAPLSAGSSILTSYGKMQYYQGGGNPLTP